MPGPSLPREEVPENRPTEKQAGPALPASGSLGLDILIAYAKAVLTELAKNRDLKSDDEGNPLVRFRSSGITGECTWQLIEADFSGLGMALDMPLLAYAYADAPEIEWHFGPTPIASTPRTALPKDAADALSMDVLLSGFRRFVLAESTLFPTALTPKSSAGVFIDPEDGTCRECDEGELEVIDADDSTMTVGCGGCGACYPVEHDAFGDGGVDYVLEFLSSKRGKGD